MYGSLPRTDGGGGGGAYVPLQRHGDEQLTRDSQMHGAAQSETVRVSQQQQQQHASYPSQSHAYPSVRDSEIAPQSQPTSSAGYASARSVIGTYAFVVFLCGIACACPKSLRITSR
jgi:hypothetical protein